MLARLWKQGTEPGAETSPPMLAPNLHHLPTARVPASRRGPKPAAAKRRRTPVQFEDIYLVNRPEPDAVVHARALLALMREHCTAGRYIPKAQLERMYGELCETEGWSPLNWVAIARRLGKMTGKRTGKRNGQKRVGYRGAEVR